MAESSDLSERRGIKLAEVSEVGVGVGAKATSSIALCNIAIRLYECACANTSPCGFAYRLM